MSILSAAIRVVRSAYVSAVSAAKRVAGFTSTPVNFNVAPGAGATMATTGLDDLYGVSAGLVRISSGSGRGKLASALASQVADEMLEAIHKALLPIKRTGALEESFHIRQNGDHIEIFSTSSYAHTILGDSESWGSPSYGSILGWMGGVTGFSLDNGLSQEQVAGAIFTSWDPNSYDSTNRSELYRLPPYGKKAYDYIGVATKQANSKIEGIVVESVRSVLHEL
jgi:hypothetical protein